MKPFLLLLSTTLATIAIAAEPTVTKETAKIRSKKATSAVALNAAPFLSELRSQLGLEETDTVRITQSTHGTRNELTIVVSYKSKDDLEGQGKREAELSTSATKWVAQKRRSLDLHQHDFIVSLLPYSYALTKGADGKEYVASVPQKGLTFRLLAPKQTTDPNTAKEG